MRRSALVFVALVTVILSGCASHVSTGGTFATISVQTVPTAAKAVPTAAHTTTASTPKPSPMLVPSLPPNCIQWDTASNYTGQSKCVCGSVVKVHGSDARGGAKYLDLSETFPNPHRFMVAIQGRYLRHFPDTLEDLYFGKIICATGIIDAYIEGSNKIPNINVTHPTAIRTIDGTVVPSPTSVPTKPSATPTATSSPIPTRSVCEGGQIAWYDANECVGWNECVHGTAIHVYTSEKASFMNFDWSRTSFYIVSFNVIFREDLIDCEVEACGIIENYHGRPRLIASTGEELTVQCPPTPEPPPPPPSPPALALLPPPCDCSYNRYDCRDFLTQSAAQACFDYCWEIRGYDVHWLDDDGDGIACELNP